MKFVQATRQLALLAACAATLAACGTGTRISAEGSTDEPKWPRWDSVTFNKNRGTFPDPSSLDQVKAGVTKDQLYYLLGRPHYDEAWRPREWNYLFHFHTPGRGTNGVSTCQFKVLFDRQMLAQNFYWNPVDGGQCPPAKAAPAKPQRYTLSADALFAFDRSDMADLHPQGRRELDNLASKIKGFDRLNRITVTGHTDRLGSDAYNQNLSQQRAETVRQYLINQGLPAGIIRAVGMGESQPVKQCAQQGSRAQLIACLQPNRRVEVQVDGSGVK